jgi:hypothetical protein
MWDHRRVLRVSLPPLLALGLAGCLTDFPTGAPYRCDTNEDCAGDNVCRAQGGERLCLTPDPRCPSGDCADAALPRVAKTDGEPDPQVILDAATAAPPVVDAGAAPAPEPCVEGEYVDEETQVYVRACGDAEGGHCRYEFEAYGDPQRCSAVCGLFHQGCAAAADDDPMWWCSPIPHDEIDCERPGRTLVCDCRR